MRILILLLVICGPVLYAADPVVSNVRVLGEALYNAGETTQLTGNYVFTDADGHTDASTYKWYSSTTADGSSGYSDTGITTQRYTVGAGDVGLYFFFEVTPIDSNGDNGTIEQNSDGTIGSSTSFSDDTYSGNPSTINSGGTTDILNGTISNNKNLLVTNNSTLYIHGDLSTGKTTITVDAGSTLQISGQLIASNNLTIVNNGTLAISSGLSAGNTADITISGDVTIGGDFSLGAGGAGSLTVDGDGSLDVEGNFDVPDSNITVTDPGTINIDGNAETGTSPIDGDGDVTIGGECFGTNCGDGQVVPIELGYFRVTSEYNFKEITWTTLTEINNDYFTIYKSEDGETFIEIAQIEGAGNHQGLLKYSYKDYDQLGKTAYYKLRQTDFDGKFEEFDAVGQYSNEFFSISIFPNPCQEWLHVFNPLPIQALSLSSLSGDVLLRIEFLNEKQVQLNVAALMPGVYLLNILTNQGRQTIRVIKK